MLYTFCKVRNMEQNCNYLWRFWTLCCHMKYGDQKRRLRWQMDFRVEFMWIFVVCILPSLWNRALPSIHISFCSIGAPVPTFFVSKENFANLWQIFVKYISADQTQSTSNLFRSTCFKHNFGETSTTVCLMFVVGPSHEVELPQQIYNFAQSKQQAFCL